MLIPYSVKVFLNKDKPKKDGMFPLYVRVILNRKKIELSTNISVTLNEWDAKLRRVKKDHEKNKEINTIEGDIYDHVKALQTQGKLYEVAQIKNLLKGKTDLEPKLTDYLAQFIFTLETSPNIKHSSFIQYKATQRHVDAFLMEKNEPNYRLRQVDYRFLLDFDLFLKKKKVLGTQKIFTASTVNKHHSRFRTLLIRAVKENLIDKNPYQSFKLKNTPSTRTFLTQEELENLINVELDNDSLSRVKDIFVFSCYTGLRFEDAQNLKMSQIQTNQKGEALISLTQQKTGHLVNIPLLKPALAIIAKYKNEERIITGNVLPKISNQKVNTYLKVIADLAGIKKNLTHHVARHTCATTILISKRGEH
jgi:integrase/recombinase XerD